MRSMKFSIVQTRRLLLQPNTDTTTTTTTLHSTMSSSDPTFQPMNDSVASAMSRPFKLTAPFDSSIALTILVLLTALFFMGFFSIYIRHFTADVTHDGRRRRNPSPPSTSGHSSCRKGVDPAVVKSLPLVSYRGPPEHLIEDCPICLTEFEASEVVKLLPYCRHVFHQHCLDTWLASHVSCPLCRSTQFFKEADEVCLDVVEVENGNGESGRSTVRECDTCRNIRRSCSYSNLGNRVALHRSSSF